jgi:hypothetical protein
MLTGALYAGQATASAEPGDFESPSLTKSAVSFGDEVLSPSYPSTSISQALISLKNGNFEKGRDGSWIESSLQGLELITHQDDLLEGVYPHSGEWVAWLGGFQDTTSISQTVTIPLETPRLQFWHWVESEYPCTINENIAHIYLDGASLADYELCKEQNTDGWQKQQLDLTPYAGQTVSLKFQAQTIVFISNYYLDDVFLVSQEVFLPLISR